LAKYVSPDVAAKLKLPGPIMLSTDSVDVVMERKRNSNPKKGSVLKSASVALYVNGAVSATKSKDIPVLSVIQPVVSKTVDASV
jgi:hypothetical protein